MLLGHAEGLPMLGSSKDLLLADPVSEINGDSDSDSGMQDQIVYMASFEELGSKNIQYDTIIWVSISLLLVLAWGVGIIMLLYLPIKRYVLRKDISSRKLYVTQNEIVYKVLRPSFIPCLGVSKIVKRVPLSQVIDIIIEQGCLQSAYGIHTFRVESIAYGKAAPVDELQVQGVYNPGLLRKVIVSEASKFLQDVGRNWRTDVHSIVRESMSQMESGTAGPTSFKNLKIAGSPQPARNRGVIHADLVLHKLEEVNKSVKTIEVLIEKSQATSQSSEL